jgi:uncharacterized protein YuzE
MKFSFDKQANAAYIKFSDMPVAWTDHPTDTVNIDMDKEASVVGVEILEFTNSVLYQEIKNLVQPENIGDRYE